MKKTLLATSALVAASLISYPSQSYAASQDECAIWICAPGGFPQGCGAAYSAMISRIKDFKPPLPPFAACAINPPVGSGSHMSASHGFAAHIAQRNVCVIYRSWGDSEHCMEYKTIPAHYVKGTTCQITDGDHNPPGCTHTKRFIEVFIEGNLAGPTFYW